MSRYMDGWNESHSSQDGDRANNERQILQDLIAELRDRAVYASSEPLAERTTAGGGRR